VEQGGRFLKRRAAVMSCFDLPLLTNRRRQACAASCAVIGAESSFGSYVGVETSLEWLASTHRELPVRMVEQLLALARAEGILEQGERPTPVDPKNFGFGGLIQASSYLLKPRKSARRMDGQQVDAEHAHIWMASDGEMELTGDADGPTAEHVLLTCIKKSAQQEEHEYRKLAGKVFEKVRAELEVRATLAVILTCRIGTFKEQAYASELDFGTAMPATPCPDAHRQLYWLSITGFCWPCNLRRPAVPMWPRG
jgi:hypothetical protein